MNKDARTPTYPRGIAGLLEQMEGRRDPFTFAPGEALPPLEVDLADLAQKQVPPPDEDPLRAMRAASSNHRKFLDLRAELAGLSELSVLHGLLIAHLRKRKQPDHTMALFERLWAEQAGHLLETLNLRWQVSAITTFGDHGRTPVQRQVGSALSVLFGIMKLYESERRYSGTDPEKPFPLDRLKKCTLPMDMAPFSIVNGGLDVNMLGRLWRDAEQDPTIQPLAHGLIDQVIHDPRTVFRRLRTMRQRRERKRATVPEPSIDPAPAAATGAVIEIPQRDTGPVTWGVVCTTNAPLPEIIPWAAHYLDLGAHHLHLYLDAPDPAVTAFFNGHDRITVTTCDADFWARRGKEKPQGHQLRQAHNATLSLHNTNVTYLGHFDIDEFLISPNPVSLALAACSPDAAFARIRPVELLAPLAGPPRHFKRSHKQAGQPKICLEELYPTFGNYLSGGMVSHTSGKVFARTGLADTRLGLHALKHRGAEVINRTDLPQMALAHLHARDVDHFLERTDFRLGLGSYRKSPANADQMKLADILSFLRDQDGEPGLRAFFDEVCTARPALLAALDARGMLLTHDLALDAKVARIFGPDAARLGAA